jgi:hypothetical protein
MAEGGAPALLGLLLEVNAGVLAATYGALALHQATAFWDVRYAESRRTVTPNEQHIHGLLENVPVMASAFLTALHWDQARALVGMGDEQPKFAPQRKRRPLSRRYVAGLAAAIMGAVVIPYAEELRRCYRADRSFRVQPEPDLPRTRAAQAPPAK